MFIKMQGLRAADSTTASYLPLVDGRDRSHLAPTLHHVLRGGVPVHVLDQDGLREGGLVVLPRTALAVPAGADLEIEGAVDLVLLRAVDPGQMLGTASCVPELLLPPVPPPFAVAAATAASSSTVPAPSTTIPTAIPVPTPVSVAATVPSAVTIATSSVASATAVVSASTTVATTPIVSAATTIASAVMAHRGYLCTRAARVHV